MQSKLNEYFAKEELGNSLIRTFNSLKTQTLAILQNEDTLLCSHKDDIVPIMLTKLHWSSEQILFKLKQILMEMEIIVMNLNLNNGIAGALLQMFKTDYCHKRILIESDPGLDKLINWNSDLIDTRLLKRLA